jgi:hypothetical protein
MVLKFKLSSAILLYLAATTIIAVGASADTAERTLQASASCLANNGTYASCCPAGGVDPNDGLCTLLSCLEIESGLTIRDGCSCYDIAKACDQLSLFATVVAALPDMCDMVGECCVDDGATTTNVDWDFCMAEAQEAGKFTLPDVASLVPGGLPVFGDDDAATATAPTTSAPTATTGTAPTSNPTTVIATMSPTNTIPTSTTTPASTTANAPTPATEEVGTPATQAPTPMPAPASGSSSNYATYSALALIGSSLMILSL